MASHKEKVVRFILSSLVIFLLLSIGSFYFIFESYEKTTIQYRISFLILDLVSGIIWVGLVFLLADEIYKEPK